MAETTAAKPKHASWVSPYLTVRDVSAALDFYQRAFGFEKLDTFNGPDGKVMHGEMRWKDVLLMLGCESDKPGCDARSPATSGIAAPVGMYVYCENVDALFDRAKGAGATVRMAPQDMFWGDRVYSFADPDGHTWTFGTHTGRFSQPH